jgi:poly-gamma-glutamate synthesis protein (capsule biosynthesis protein)
MIAVCHKEGMIADKNSAGIFCIEKNLNLIQSITAELKQKHDWVFLNYHGGEEYTQIPMPSRKKLLRKLTNTKADIIIAHHSHVFQGYETYNEKPIFYSLGNFVFDIPPHKNIHFIEQTAILNFNFTKIDFEYSFKPVVISIENKKIISGDSTFIDTINEISQKIYTNYSKHWRVEAHRTFFNANKKNIVNSSNQTAIVGKRHQDIIQLIFKFDTFYKFYKLLKSKNKRPLFLGAIAYKILK